jgi:hypothetical protein
MAHGRVLVAVVASAVALGACGLDVVGKLGATDGGASPAPGDGATGTDGAGDATPSPLTDGGVIVLGDGGGDAADGAVIAIAPACAAGKVLCGGSCVTATDCTACAGNTLLCAPLRKCVASCATCTDVATVAMPIECIACNSSQNNPIGSCGYNNPTGFCLGADYSAAYQGGAGEHCDCSGTDVSNCVGRDQVCKPHNSSDWCITCGESGLATNGLPCKGGGACNTSVSPPRCM